MEVKPEVNGDVNDGKQNHRPARIAGPTNPMVTPLLTDLYQFTMASAYWRAGKHYERVVYLQERAGKDHSFTYEVQSVRSELEKECEARENLENCLIQLEKDREEEREQAQVERKNEQAKFEKLQKQMEEILKLLGNK